MESREERDTDKNSLGQKVKFFADIVLKFTPAIATVVMGLIAYDFQSKSSAATLLNQREQAETQLRAALFKNLIGPLGGATDGKVLDADHQRLLVELLMLNFHEHIEFKPLLIHTDERLVKGIEDKTKAQDARNSLRSVARRVRERQVSVLMKEQEHASESVEDCSGNAYAYVVSCEFLSSQNSLSTDENKVWNVHSPDGKYSIKVRIKEMDWNNEQFEVSFVIIDNKNSKISRASSFNVTSYDLPFTDNMIIDHNQKFALGVSYVDRVEEMHSWSESVENSVTLQAVWFPKGYILPHERPVNYQEIRELLNLQDEEEKPQLHLKQNETNDLAQESIKNEVTTKNGN